MKAKTGFICVVLVLTSILIACGPPAVEELNIYKRENRFPCPENFKSTAAWVTFEWNGRPLEFKGEQYGYGSGFLADRSKGLFYSNRHVTTSFDSLGEDGHKIFFNCRVYNAVVARVAPWVDASVFRITDSFDWSDFPAPDPITEEKIKIGDKVFVEGLHPHPYDVRQKDAARGLNYPLIPIYKDYYRFVGTGVDVYKEIVHEGFEGTVKELAVQAEVESDDPPHTRELKRQNVFYDVIEIDNEHLFSFGGLSGSAVKNKKGEVVGIVTIESKKYENWKTVYQTILITPVSAIEDLQRFVKEAR